MLYSLEAANLAALYDPWNWVDARKAPKGIHSKSRRVAEQYGREMRKIAREIGRIVLGFPDLDPATLPQLEHLLNEYSKLLTPWAKHTAWRMLIDANTQDLAAWRRHASIMNRALMDEIQLEPTGLLAQAFMAEQVDLITSLPKEAGQRVHELVIEAAGNAPRAEEIADMIMQTGEVTASRATLIARTEIGRLSTNLTMTRAMSVGSETYTWRTMRDRYVRQTHRHLEGQVFRWDDPPIAGEKGERSHPGAIYNCRCYPEPHIPDII